MNGDEVIAIYESISRLTDEMLAAARAADWELLATLETQCGKHISNLRNCEESISLSDELRSRKVDIIKKILEDDRDIRNLTEPGLRKLSALIQSNQTEQKLLNTYGMGS
ncbi:flagellar protein FliT [Herbaspirillum seropedicae]|uniref:Flagellar protein FliT n=1 Tax=Herbaspirillum seropedicae (strain SmR1) TaxID=757424 RepID=D8IT06_HERSS|nr:flagellar protein FliT [Herbaspirillum seropedicae]ADJ63565.1 flagellar FliT protein [Herbaspirillum seropedicae SmR1]AKN65594.1 flagellar synthesis protein [Herbaspirillum seropedicae]AON54393.1 flagellar protein FliT [Herbaspirillum seropedicae]MDR6394559.1 flagellar protein FliT [Herbaspirillum seropedicae]NQE28753.1 flagellar synthesis protein [Herbaspirillum seropedicae]